MTRPTRSDVSRRLDDLEPDTEADTVSRPDLSPEEKRVLDRMFDPDRETPEADRVLDDLHSELRGVSFEERAERWEGIE